MKSRVLKVVTLLAGVAVMAVISSGCYLWHQVESNQVGLQMDDGVTISNVVGSGRYTRLAPFAKMKEIDVSAKTVIWEDPDLWTSDKQPVEFRISLTYSRKRDTESVRKMWEQYNAEAREDKALEQLVLTRIPRVAKQITTSMTLDQMLGIEDGSSKAGESNAEKGRTILQDNMSKLLKEELQECGIELLDVGVNDIGVDEEYAKKLKEKAASKVASEVSQQRTIQLQEQIKQEQAQTAIDLEIANRKNQVQAKENEVYTLNPQAFELERLRLLKDVIGENDKIYFIPEGSNLNVILSGGNTSIIPSSATEEPDK